MKLITLLSLPLLTLSSPIQQSYHQNAASSGSSIGKGSRGSNRRDPYAPKPYNPQAPIMKFQNSKICKMNPFVFLTLLNNDHFSGESAVLESIGHCQDKGIQEVLALDRISKMYPDVIEDVIGQGGLTGNIGNGYTYDYIRNNFRDETSFITAFYKFKIYTEMMANVDGDEGLIEIVSDDKIEVKLDEDVDEVIEDEEENKEEGEELESEEKNESEDAGEDEIDNDAIDKDTETEADVEDKDESTITDE